MRRLLLVLLLLVVGVVILGFYLGWFQFSTAEEAGERTDVKVRINRNKIKSDAERAKQKVKGAFGGAKDKGEGK
jgi:hypothetical protein